MVAPPRLPDLVIDSQLETEVVTSAPSFCVRHISYENGQSVDDRHVRREELWEREGCVARRAYSSVWLERCSGSVSPKFRAVKEIKKDAQAGKGLDYTRELEAAAKFSNPIYVHCFVQSKGWFEVDDSIFIAMEYLDQGDLQSHLTSPLPESEARQIISQIREGLCLMHKNKFVHGDVKPANIMVVRGSPSWFVKLSDFGSARRPFEETMPLTMDRYGTLAYVAPESLSFVAEDDRVFAADMWSLGAVAFVILTNTAAFKNMHELFTYVEGTSSFPTAELEKMGVSEQGQNFIAALMKPKPGDRLTASDAAHHPWITGVCTSSHVPPRYDYIYCVCHPLEPEWMLNVPSESATSPSLAPTRAWRMESITYSCNAHRSSWIGLGSIYVQPFVTDCPEDTSTTGPSLPADSNVLLEPATSSEVPIASGKHTKPAAGPSEAAGTKLPTVCAAGDGSSPCQPAPHKPPFNVERKEGDERHPIPESRTPEYTPNVYWPASGESTPDPTPAASRYHRNNFPGFGRHLNPSCKQCSTLTSQIERLTCGHYMCHQCLISLVALSLISPKFMPPRCCECPLGSGEIKREALGKIILTPDVNSTLCALYDLEEKVRSGSWSCPDEHPPHNGSPLVTYSSVPVWKGSIECTSCFEPESPYTTPTTAQESRRTGLSRKQFCLFCCGTYGECLCLENHNSVIKRFVRNLGATGILSDHFLSHINSAKSAMAKLGNDGSGQSFVTFNKMKSAHDYPLNRASHVHVHKPENAEDSDSLVYDSQSSEGEADDIEDDSDGIPYQRQSYANVRYAPVGHHPPQPRIYTQQPHSPHQGYPQFPSPEANPQYQWGVSPTSNQPLPPGVVPIYRADPLAPKVNLPHLRRGNGTRGR
ncbi:kinase-like domain-containing protein [Xylariales sp. PMI_506]|nr:kinase-like domain-containing protein [Xylariales sp. PMI_506]